MGNKNKLPDVFNPDQLVQLIDSANSPKIGIAIALAFFCGLRISEVCNLKWDDIDFDLKKLKVVDSKFSMRAKTKYGKDRYVKIPDPIISPLKKWKDLVGGGKWFLVSDKSPDVPMRKKTLGERFRIVLERAGLLIPDYDIVFKQKIFGEVKEKKVTRYKYRFHTLRHSYATYLIDKGADILTVSHLLGHNQVTTTQIYARVSSKQVDKTINQAFNLQSRTRVIPQEDVRRISYPQQSQSPENFLKMQVARGEITADEFREKMQLFKDVNTRMIESK
jgi:integrase/recombinase XerD